MDNLRIPDFYFSSPQTVKVSGNPVLGFTKNAKRIALVAQGGGQRGVFTAGVLDSFIKQCFDPFELYLGTSAGALNLSTYLARNHGFAYKFITKFTTKSEFFNLIKYVRRRQAMDLDWAIKAAGLFDPNVFNVEKARDVLKRRQAFACATEVSTLSAHFLSMFEGNWIEVLKASSAIPILYEKPVEIEGKRYIDGGVSAAIPIKEAYYRGADIVVVIRTESLLEDKKPISSLFLENIRNRVEKHLPSYLEKFQLEDQFEKLSRYHSLLSVRLQSLHNKYTGDAWKNFKTRMPEKLKRNGGRWLFGGDEIYRLQALSGQKINVDMVEMLAKHYQTYQDCIRFLQQPPSRLQIIQLCPSKPLASSPLLSKLGQLDQDYQDGLKVGKVFVNNFAAYMNAISTVKRV